MRALVVLDLVILNESALALYGLFVSVSCVLEDVIVDGASARGAWATGIGMRCVG